MEFSFGQLDQPEQNGANLQSGVPVRHHDPLFGQLKVSSESDYHRLVRSVDANHSNQCTRQTTQNKNQSAISLQAGLVNDESIENLLTTVNPQVPRSDHHLVWRLALVLRHQTSQVNTAGSRAHFTWGTLRDVFASRLTVDGFRKFCLRRKCNHVGHLEIDFDVLQCPPDTSADNSSETVAEVEMAAVARPTLQKQLMLSVKSRAAKLSAEHQTRLSASRLRAIYKEARISPNKVTIIRKGELVCSDRVRVKRQFEAENLRVCYETALRLGLNIIYIDEVKFQYTVEFKNLKAWAGPNDKLVAIDCVKENQNVTVFAAMSSEGLVYWQLVQGKFDACNYMSHLRNLRDKLSGANVALFYDGLSTHKTKAVMNLLLDDFGWVPIQNIAYSPNHNPIETLFSQIKRIYRARAVSIDVTENHDEIKLLKKNELVQTIFAEFERRDCSRLIAGAERAMEKKLGYQFNREKIKQNKVAFKTFLQQLKQQHYVGQQQKF